MRLKKLIKVLLIMTYIIRIVLSALTLYLSIKVSIYLKSFTERRKFKKILHRHRLPKDLVNELYNSYSRSLSNFNISLEDLTEMFKMTYRKAS